MTDASLQSVGDVAMAQMQSASLSGHKLHGKMSDDAIDKKAKEFESMFVSQMVQPMFEGLDVDKMFGGGHGEEMMRSFLIQEYGKAMAANGHFGIADAVKKEMIRSQEAGAASVPNPSQGAAYASVQ